MSVFHVQFVLGVCFLQDQSAVPQNALMSVFHVQFVLGVCSSKGAERYRSGGANLLRPVSSAVQTYSTRKEDWPLNEPMTKTEAAYQVRVVYAVITIVIVVVVVTIIVVFVVTIIIVVVVTVIVVVVVTIVVVTIVVIVTITIVVVVTIIIVVGVTIIYVVGTINMYHYYHSQNYLRQYSIRSSMGYKVDWVF